MSTEGLLRETAIVAKAPEDVTMTTIATTTCKVYSVLILKMYFMLAPDGREAKIPQNREALQPVILCVRLLTLWREHIL
jgi:hypothetical protein